MISVISVKVQMIIVNVLAALLTMITSLILALTIISFLILMNPLIAISVILFFGALYALLTYLTRKEINRGGQIIADESTKIVKTLQEGLGGIRDIILDGTQNFYLDLYSKSEINLRKAQIKNQVVRESPRFVMEAIAMVGIATLAYLITGDDGVSKALPLLGAVAIGSQRLLPLIQNGYNALIKLRGSLAAIQDIARFLSQEKLDYLADVNNKDKLEFVRNIELKEIEFSYTESGLKVFDGINLEISKGSKIGFVGKTGSGKSTLIDIIMGLLEPVQGSIFIDKTKINKKNLKSWQNNIAHVPQHIYLSDESITNNIAFGLSKEDIDISKVKEAAEQAKIAETIEKMPKKYDTKIGERGIRLSGGQRQRIGIARALYKGADLIVLDEATSALDNTTEKEIMDIFNNLGKGITLLVIAHRVSTLTDCNKIYEIKDGLINEVKLSSCLLYTSPSPRDS